MCWHTLCQTLSVKKVWSGYFGNHGKSQFWEIIRFPKVSLKSEMIGCGSIFWNQVSALSARLLTIGLRKSFIIIRYWSPYTVIDSVPVFLFKEIEPTTQPDLEDKQCLPDLGRSLTAPCLKTSNQVHNCCILGCFSHIKITFIGPLWECNYLFILKIIFNEFGSL